MKTLVLKYDYGYDVFAFDETKEEIMTYPNLTIFLNKMCSKHFENYEVRTLYEYDLMREIKNMMLIIDYGALFLTRHCRHLKTCLLATTVILHTME